MKKILAAGLLILLAAAGSGCQFTGSDTTSPADIPEDQPETGINLDAETGGLSFDDEDTAFGEPERYEALLREKTYEDPYRNQKHIREMERRRGTRIYRLRAIWGHLLNACDDTTTTECWPIDWTGTLHMEGGVVVIEKVIAFEAGEYVHRIDRSTIGWVSGTCPHIDGIQVRLIVPPPDSTSTASIAQAEPVLVFETGPFSEQFTLKELAAMQFLRYVDRCGNGISIASHIVHPFCPHGHLLGGWRSIEPDTILSPDSTETRGIVHGRFRGVWIGQHGHAAGYLKGVYDVNSAGERVFFGKYVDEEGRFMGILRGHYGPAPALDAENRFPRGWFEGTWIGRDRIVKGRLKGHWAADEPGFGFFHGVWGMKCSNAL